MNLPQIHLDPDILFTVGPVPVSNAMLSAFFVSFLLIVLGILVKTRIALIPGRLQMLIEIIVTFYLEKMEMALGSEKEARRLTPFIVTVALIVVISNQLTLIPLLGSITAGDVNLFKTPTAHYSLTIALTVLGLVSVHAIVFLKAPLRHLGNFFKFHLLFKMKSIKELPMVLIEIFLGLMDIIGEIAKLVSLSTRLFGNMFAGEVVVLIISSLLFATQFLFPIPFIVLSILSGFVQAFVFSILLGIFMSGTWNGIKEKAY
ncbi:MAG: hypothetical protein ACD_28C00035G0010 [uncultured bacterium]|nr:MAG: hypothetical protein ACD_28C00035G0010 [uncultured bacterium]KKT72879.1 MAG: ATP synthase subunit a [Candidatus Peregrinibacteria bacterium GW2011_GWA2_44_7]